MSEFKFDSEGFDPSVEDTYTYTNPLEENMYTFMSNTYEGTGGFLTGTYLIPHSREGYYKDRKVYSHYKNYLKPITNALVDPVFMHEAPRVITDESGVESSAEESNTLFSKFIEDCDNNSTKLQEFSEQVLTYARLHGVTFVVMDNFSDLEQPETEQEAIENRILPYVYIETADKVYEYNTDPWGRLESIVFREADVLNEKGEAESRYRYWNSEYSVLMTKDKNDKLVAVEAPSYHYLGVVPVTSVVAGKKGSQNKILVNPPLYDIARLNLSVYNKDSEIRELERLQSFSIFYLQSDSPGNVTAGSSNVFFIPSDTQIPPGFASPDPNILKGLLESCNSLTESIYQIAEQNGVKGVQSAKSGVAIQWDFYAHETQLKKTSRLATTFEYALADLFKRYTNTVFTYTVEYPDDFLPGDTSNELENIKKVLDMGVPQMMVNKLHSKVARMMLSDEDKEELQLVIDDIMSQEQQPKEIPFENIERDAEGEE